MATIPSLNNSTPVTDDTEFVGRDPVPTQQYPQGEDRRYSGKQLREYINNLPPIIFEGVMLVLSAEHSARMVWTTSDEPVFVYFPNDIEGPFEGALVQGGEGQVTFLTLEGDELVAESGLTGTAGRGAPVSYKFIQPGLWWLGGQRAEGQVPGP